MWSLTSVGCLEYVSSETSWLPRWYEQKFFCRSFGYSMCIFWVICTKQAVVSYYMAYTVFQIASYLEDICVVYSRTLSTNTTSYKNFDSNIFKVLFFYSDCSVFKCHSNEDRNFLRYFMHPQSRKSYIASRRRCKRVSREVNKWQYKCFDIWNGSHRRKCTDAAVCSIRASPVCSGSCVD